MSLIIKGMKFPKCCDSCELVQDYDEDTVCCPFMRSESWYGAAPDYTFENIGKRLFLTREAAEQALKERENSD